jgi:hypothetical protein
MKFTARILATGIVGLTLFACAPTGPTIVRAPTLATTSACVGSALNKVPFLLLPFDPTKNFATNSIPQPDAAAIPADVWTDLQKAFSIAPAGFQQQLCSLNGIFINPEGCSRSNPNDPTSPYVPTTCNPSPVAVGNNSWGMRQYDPNSGTILGRYVALSLGLWNNSASPGWSCGARTYCAPPFQTFQTGVIRALLMALAPTVSISAAKLPTISVSTSANTAEMSVLATLAHEYGHVLWYDTFVSMKGGGSADPTAGPCGGQFYTPAIPAWKYTLDVPPGRWLTFGQIREQSPLNSTILNLPGFYTANLPGLAGDNLNRLFTGGYWASTLAAFSPDEDFVETFELTVLAAAKPASATQPLFQSMVITIPGTRKTYSPDVFDSLVPGTELARKYVCIAGALPAQAQTRHRL